MRILQFISSPPLLLFAKVFMLQCVFFPLFSSAVSSSCGVFFFGKSCLRFDLKDGPGIPGSDCLGPSSRRINVLLPQLFLVGKGFRFLLFPCGQHA